MEAGLELCTGPRGTTSPSGRTDAPQRPHLSALDGGRPRAVDAAFCPLMDTTRTLRGLRLILTKRIRVYCYAGTPRGIMHRRMKLASIDAADRSS